MQVLNLLKLFPFLIPTKLMPRLAVVRARNLIKILEKVGFYRVRQNGSHIFFTHADGRCTTVPVHSRDIPSGTLRGILNDIDILKDEFSTLLKK